MLYNKSNSLILRCVMDKFEIQTFEGDPKITLTLEHLFIEVSVSVKVRSESYPVTGKFDEDMSEVRRSLFLQAVEAVAPRIARAASESHVAFEEAYQQVMVKRLQHRFESA